MLNERGILIIATGHPYYGRMAYNLCVSIKANEPDIPIALVYNEEAISHLDDYKRWDFDFLIPAQDLHIGTAAKLFAYDYTPFENTLLLDADMIWLPDRKPSQLFDYFKDTEFTCIAEGTSENPSGDYYFWAGMEEIRMVYGIQSMYQFRSEVMFFKKTDRIKKFFDDAKIVYANPRLKTIRQHAGTVPDELALNIAAAQNDIHPHAVGWNPSYWFQLNQMKMPDPTTLAKTYFLASMGGNVAPGPIKKFYNTLMAGYLTRMKRPPRSFFELDQKKDLIRSRQVN